MTNEPKLEDTMLVKLHAATMLRLTRLENPDYVSLKWIMTDSHGLTDEDFKLLWDWLFEKGYWAADHIGCTALTMKGERFLDEETA